MTPFIAGSPKHNPYILAIYYCCLDSAIIMSMLLFPVLPLLIHRSKISSSLFRCTSSAIPCPDLLQRPPRSSNITFGVDDTDAVRFALNVLPPIWSACCQCTNWPIRLSITAEAWLPQPYASDRSRFLLSLPCATVPDVVAEILIKGCVFVNTAHILRYVCDCPSLR